jgi:hypothetical protein
MGRIEIVAIGGDNFTGAMGGVMIDDAVVLDAKPADGRRHPAVLIAVIVDAAVLPNFPADGHAFEDLILENQIAGVIALGKKTVLFDRLRANRVANDVVLDILEREIALGNGGEALDPIGDGELLDCDVWCHVAPPEDVPEKSGVAGEL